jgi:hypothetical protein
MFKFQKESKKYSNPFTRAGVTVLKELMVRRTTPAVNIHERQRCLLFHQTQNVQYNKHVTNKQVSQKTHRNGSFEARKLFKDVITDLHSANVH